MTISEVQRLSESKAGFQDLYDSLPEPHYPKPINTDPDSPESIMSDFIARKPSDAERTELQNDLISLAKLGRK